MMKHRTVCEAVKKGEVGRRGVAVTEFYIDGEPQVYCLGYGDAMNDEPIDTCKNCRDFDGNSDEDFEKYMERKGR